jgi:hypothetical protein
VGNYRFISFINQYYRNLPYLPIGKGNLVTLHQLWSQLSPTTPVDSLIFADQLRLAGPRFFSPNINNFRKCLGKPPNVFLFQGYGWQGTGQDYLLPVDGDVEALAATAVNFRDIIYAFRPFQSPCVLLLLDLVSVDDGLLSEPGINPISSENLLRAKQRGINVIARFSRREPGELTTILIEALSYYQKSITVELLESFIRNRLETAVANDDCSLISLTGNHQIRTQLLFPDPNQMEVTDNDWDEWLESSRQQLVAVVRQWRSSPTIAMGWFWLSLALLIFSLGGLIIWATQGLVRVDEGRSPSLNPGMLSPIDQAYLVQMQAAKTHLRWQQASVFVRAIAELRKVPPESPQYTDAQRQITQWSEIILDIAKGRSEVGNSRDAIAAAALVPPDQPELFKQAQAVIQQWQ